MPELQPFTFHQKLVTHPGFLKHTYIYITRRIHIVLLQTIPFLKKLGNLYRLDRGFLKHNILVPKAFLSESLILDIRFKAMHTNLNHYFHSMDKEIAFS